MKIPFIFLITSLFSIVLCSQDQKQTFEQQELIPYRIGNQWGYANRQQELVIPATYAEAELFNEYGLAKVSTGGPNKSQMETGYINRSGNEVIEIGRYPYLSAFKDSLVIFEIVEENPRTIKYGLVDVHGNELIPAKYRELKILDNGLIWVNDNYQFGIMNRKGDIIIPFEYDGISEFSEGLAVVKKNDKHGIINESGEVIVPLIYDAINDSYFDFRNNLDKINTQAIRTGLIPAKLKKWGFINLEGNEVIGFQYDMVGFFHNGFSIVANNYEGNKKKWGLISRKGNLALPIEYNGLGDFKYGISSTWRDGKVGFINREGKTVIPFKYDWAEGFENGFAIVGISKKTPNTGRNWGFVDSTGTEVVKCQYDKVYDFRDGLACVVKDSKYGYIDTSGKIVIPLEYAATFERVMNGYIVASKDGMIFGVLDAKGNEVIPFRYNIILPIPDQPDIFRVSIFDLQNRTSQEGYVDIDGNRYFED